MNGSLTWDWSRPMLLYFPKTVINISLSLVITFYESKLNSDKHKKEAYEYNNNNKDELWPVNYKDFR